MSGASSPQDLLAGFGLRTGAFATAEGGAPRLPFGGNLMPPSASQCAASSDPLAQVVCGLWQDGGLSTFGSPFRPLPGMDAPVAAADAGAEDAGIAAIDASSAVASDAGEEDAGASATQDASSDDAPSAQ